MGLISSRSRWQGGTVARYIKRRARHVTACDALTLPSRGIFLMVWASAVMTSSDLCGINGAMKVARKQGMAGDRPHRILHKSGEGVACP